MSAIDTEAIQRAQLTASRMAEAARGLLVSLGTRQRERLALPWSDERFIWDWLPGEARPRVGVRLLHMTDEQQRWVLALLDAALGTRAARQVNDARRLEAHLRQFEKINPDVIFV